MTVTSSQAVVFKGGGRRYLTLKSACKAEARALINTRCDCEYMDHGSMGGEWLTCWHHEEERNAVLMRRLTGGYMRRYRAQNPRVKP
ncbi:hypothetical protein QMK50_24230 [Pseudomonas sp. P5_152]|uniref:hypothetical protein n=1 Tax=Pseudomonas sp. P5_152 TaxID=3043442 RepID=UPI002A36EAD0|nr:hypothetical protein [Pseudomonas sp. P5_152]MDX9668061.1 hypothetical protein [Pseudomonas sp. P5_152]